MVAVQARGGRRGEPARGGEINLSPVPARQEAVAAFNPHSTYPCHTPHLRPPQLRSSPATPRCATCACGAARTHAAPGAAGAARRWRGGRSTSVWRFPAWPCWPASAACSRQVTWTALCCAAPLLHRGSVTGSVPHMRAHAHMHAPPPPPPPPPPGHGCDGRLAAAARRGCVCHGNRDQHLRWGALHVQGSQEEAAAAPAAACSSLRKHRRRERLKEKVPAPPLPHLPPLLCRPGIHGGHRVRMCCVGAGGLLAWRGAALGCQAGHVDCMGADNVPAGEG